MAVQSAVVKINKTATEYSDKMWRILQPNILFCNILLLSHLLIVVRFSLFYTSMCSRGEKEKDRKKGGDGERGGKCPCAIIQIFYENPHGQASISFWEPTQAAVFLSLFILTTCSLKWRCKSASENGSNTSSEYFYISFFERVYVMLHLHFIHSFVSIYYTQYRFQIL